jgi:hypothetical protein
MTKNVNVANMRQRDDVLTSDVEAEAPEAIVFWWKRKRLKICRFRFHSVFKVAFRI